jgi:hypothetical protein
MFIFKGSVDGNNNAEQFYQLFKDVNGYSVSGNARIKHHDQAICSKMLYGETLFDGMKEIFNHELISHDIKKAKVFYDMGSGIGNVVIGTALLGMFKKCIGIELLEGLYSKALEQHQKLLEINKKIANSITFINSSFIDHDIRDGDVFFINHPTTDPVIIKKLEDKLQTLRKGSIVLCVIRSLENDNNFAKLGSRLFKFSWGDSTVHFYKKSK